jgi:hypothetical protein
MGKKYVHNDDNYSDAIYVTSITPNMVHILEYGYRTTICTYVCRSEPSGTARRMGCMGGGGRGRGIAAHFILFFCPLQIVQGSHAPRFALRAR